MRGDGSAARTPDWAVAAFADTAAVPVEGFTASDIADKGTAASATRGVAAALAEWALLCHLEHALRDPFLHGSPVLLVTHAENDSCALYLVDCNAWPIFRELLSCSIPCLQEHPVSLYSRQKPQDILQTSSVCVCVGCGLYLLTGEFARSLVLFQKGLLGLPVSLSDVPSVLFDGFRFQFVLAGLDHCIQHYLPPWAWVM